MSISPIDKYEIENTSAFDTDGADDFEATIDLSDSGITELPATLRSETPPSGTSLSSTSRQASESDLDIGQKVHQKRLDPDATFIISLGLRANDQKFTTAAVTAKKLVRFNFSDHPVGDKDGHCFTQGQIGTDGGRRIAKKCASQSLMVFDVDNGATMDEVCQEADKRGLAYIATHTHSHMKPYSRLAESKVESLLRADGLSFDNADDDNIERVITEYLSDVKGIKKSLLDTVTGVERKMADGGMVYDLHHAPMHRSRIIFFLFETFDFENPRPHKDREQLWSESYPKVAHALKIPFDSSCGDPSRLFYFPRRPLDSDAGDYENRVQLDGNYLDLAGVCSEVGLDSSYMPPKSKRGSRLGSRNTSRNSAGSYRPKTRGLMQFMKDHASDFQIADWLEQNYPDDARSDYSGDKLEHRCPNADAHSDGDNDDDSAFCVWNPDPDQEGKGFQASCRHATCLSESGDDRLFYLDKLCQNYGADVDELLQFCPNYDGEDCVRSSLGLTDEQSIISAIETNIDPNSDDTDIEPYLLAAHNLSNRMALDRIKKKVVERAGIGKSTVNEMLKRAISKSRVSRSRLSQDLGHNNGDPELGPEQEFQVNQDGAPYNNQKNISVAISRLGVKLSFDEFSGRPLISGLTGFGPNLEDDAVNRMRLTIDQQFGFLPTKDFFYDCVSDLTKRNSFHPARDYFDQVEEDWDGQKRLHRLAADYFGAEDSALNQEFLKLFMIATVRRVRRPGAKFDEMIVIEGKQGTAKSTALNILAVRDEWFSDCLDLNSDSQKIIEQTQGKLIVEIPELQGMRHTDVERLKATLSRTVDRARQAYGRLTVERPRSFIIAGTSNNDKYLKDRTGNRRFWPLKTGDIDINKLRKDLDQLWGEAANLEAKKCSIRLGKKYWDQAASLQKLRREENKYIDTLSKHLVGKTGAIKIADVYELLGLRSDQRYQGVTDDVNEAMSELGWSTKKPARWGNKTHRAFVQEEHSVHRWNYDPKERCLTPANLEDKDLEDVD